MKAFGGRTPSRMIRKRCGDATSQPSGDSQTRDDDIAERQRRQFAGQWTCSRWGTSDESIRFGQSGYCGRIGKLSVDGKNRAEMTCLLWRDKRAEL
ncbi:MAG: hypothetical protein IKP64_13185 [Selenomonadaceae bacterium]|nr:hypothetical protein [Selenomonadaceae bacterium]